MDTGQMKAAWRLFLDWVARSSHTYSMKWPVVIGSIPARDFWDVQSWRRHWAEWVFPNLSDNPLVTLFDDALAHLHQQPVFVLDGRPGAAPNNAWWAGDAGQVGWFIWGFESLWLPASLLEENAQERFADALFLGSRYSDLALHFNKGLAGAPASAIADARHTAMNPAVLTAFALAIAADAQGPAYPGIPGHEPSVMAGRRAAARIDRCMRHLRELAGTAGSYVSESNYFEKGWQESYWGGNYSRLAEIKRKYDPHGLFFVHHGVGSEQWSADGFTRQ
jgi:hypothetical protein